MVETMQLVVLILLAYATYWLWKANHQLFAVITAIFTIGSLNCILTDCKNK